MSGDSFVTRFEGSHAQIVDRLNIAQQQRQLQRVEMQTYLRSKRDRFTLYKTCFEELEKKYDSRVKAMADTTEMYVRRQTKPSSRQACVISKMFAKLETRCKAYEELRQGWISLVEKRDTLERAMCQVIDAPTAIVIRAQATAGHLHHLKSQREIHTRAVQTVSQQLRLASRQLAQVDRTRTKVQRMLTLWDLEIARRARAWSKADSELVNQIERMMRILVNRCMILDTPFDGLTSLPQPLSAEEEYTSSFAEDPNRWKKADPALLSRRDPSLRGIHSRLLPIQA